MDRAIKGHDLGQDARFGASESGSLSLSNRQVNWRQLRTDGLGKGWGRSDEWHSSGLLALDRRSAMLPAKPIAAALDRTKKNYLTEHLDRFVPCGSSGDPDGMAGLAHGIYIRPTRGRGSTVRGALEAATLAQCRETC